MSNTMFKLDLFQEEAINELRNGFSVVVSAPTGSGKTAIAEFVINEALKGKERVFYTTPLKALTNQKFHDFQKKYGEEKVGILTGDSAINREAQIVVMTTEIYRNMLYGTALGSVDENLKYLRYLVLDECHYMNDRDRGTVWEESIIYSPRNIQILALSATVANSKELTDWISQIHEETKLIESFVRPVPLRFFYYKNNNLIPLLTTNNKLNPNLKEIKDSFKANKIKFKDRMRLQEKRDLGLIPKMALELNKKGLLPAIYFVFSRRGCEVALRDCKELGFGLLSFQERDTLSKLIQERTHGNDYLFKHKHLGALYQGIAVHHAGLLPQWKAIVEELFSKGLIKMVFATETLSAGINMPAKTTIISNLSKRGDSGHQNLSSNQFLQMAGRAGRRGMDKLGNVVIKETNEHTPGFAAKLATSSPDPLISQFTPNYSMALNLLQNHTPEQIQDLLKKSFGQYLINRNLKSSVLDIDILNEKLKKLSVYPCPDKNNPGDIKIFRKQEEKINSLKRLLKILEEQSNPEYDKFRLELIEEEEKNIYYPCYDCKNKKHCYVLEKEHRKHDGKLKTLEKISEEQENYYWNRFNNICEILKKLNYIQNDVPTEKGLMAASLRGENILFLSEVILNCDFKNLSPSEFGSSISALAIDSVRPRTFSTARPTISTEKIFISMEKVYRDIHKTQRDYNVEVPINVTTILAGLVEYWCKPEVKWEDLHKVTNLDEGDLVRGIRRTMDLLRHIKNAPYLEKHLGDLAKQALELMEKDPVKEDV